jgi:thiamine pyrophosphokinase
MSLPCIASDVGVTILGAGEALEADLALALSHAPVLVAADGGAARAVALGHEVAAVIGDLDSLDPATRAAIPPQRIHLIPEQETTDFDKCLRSVSAPLVLAVGFTGARLDHGLAAFSSLVRHPHMPCILLGPEDLAFAAPPLLDLDLVPGTRVSLFPMALVTGEAEGLRWPLAGLAFAPDGRIGTSNEAVGPRVRLRFDAPGMLVLLPRDCLEAAISALAPGSAAPERARGG